MNLSQGMASVNVHSMVGITAVNGGYKREVHTLPKGPLDSHAWAAGKATVSKHILGHRKLFDGD